MTKSLLRSVYTGKENELVNTLQTSFLALDSLMKAYEDEKDA